MFWNETETVVAQPCEGTKWFILRYMNLTSIKKKGSKNTPLYFLFTKRKSHHLWTSNLGDGVEIHKLKEDNNTDRRRPRTFSSLDLRTGGNRNWQLAVTCLLHLEFRRAHLLGYSFCQDRAKTKTKFFNSTLRTCRFIQQTLRVQQGG